MRRTQEVFRFCRGERKGQAGEALRVNHERPLYREFLGQGKILSYVQDATPATGVAQRYLELGGK